jgi:hypothetical protein
MSDFPNPLISALSGLVGVFLGGWLSDRRERQKQRNDFIRLQLSEFYGPLLSIFTEIGAREALRVKVVRTITHLHERQMQEIRQQGHEVAHHAGVDSLNKLAVATNDERRIFCETAMPAYRKMLAIFREKIWLVEPATRNYFTPFVEFIDIWERTLRDTISPDIVTEMGHDAQNLHSFYCNIESTHDLLRQRLMHQAKQGILFRLRKQHRE